MCVCARLRCSCDKYVSLWGYGLCVVLCYALCVLACCECFAYLVLSHGFIMFGGWLYLGVGVGARLQCTYDL